MNPADPKQSFSLAGQILRTPQEITRVLNSLLMRNEPISCELFADKLRFHSRLRFIDPQRDYIIIERSDDEAANRALLARARATFHAEPGGWRVQFAAAAPQPARMSDGTPGIRLHFPEVVAGHRQRESERNSVANEGALRCVVDERGVTPFDARLTNLSKGGIGFLQYDSAIGLEPGTMLRGCRIDSTSGASVLVDMEVRYSQLVTLEGGRQVQSAGCRFIGISREDLARIEQMFGLES